jgi:hypothetical protein
MFYVFKELSHSRSEIAILSTHRIISIPVDASSLLGKGYSANEFTILIISTKKETFFQI